MIRPENIAEAFQRAGRLQTSGRLRDAAALWCEILMTDPDNAEAHGNYAGVLLELGDPEAAEPAIRRALALKPQAPWALYRLGRVMHLTGRLDEAEAAYRTCLDGDPADPKTRLALGQLYLLRGDLARGWPLYEARSEIPSQNAAPLGLPNPWRGEPLAGRSILLWPEQGFGDQIQFARFAPHLQALGAEVTLAAPRELEALFATLGVRIARQTPKPPPASTTDYSSLLLSVPGALGATLADLPPAPYLAAPADRRTRWAGYAMPGSVGIVWRGRPTHPADGERSLPGPELFQPLKSAGATLVDLTYPIGDFADLAAVIEQLDLVVSVDTAVAHLAGALGKRCFVLLPAWRTDWRWLEGREDSPWYPSVRLFRQPRRGDWTGVMRKVAEAYAAEFRA